MKYIVVVEKGPESYGAYVPDLPGCAVIGESRGEVVKLIQEAIELHLQTSIVVSRVCRCCRLTMLKVGVKNRQVS